MPAGRRPVVRFALAALCAAAPVCAQQVADTTFRPVVAAPAWPPGTGPLVLIDEAHWNFHTAGGRFLPFARLLERDGFRVEHNRAPFTRDALARAAVLVVANALGDTGDWVLPTRPAFTAREVAEVRRWVEGGGALLLIADHMPFPGAAANLARALGVEFLDGFALDSLGRAGIAMFRRAGGSLAAHPVTDGAGPGTRIDSVATFTGQGFRLAGRGAPLLRLDRRFAILLPRRAWEFGPDTPRRSGVGLLQGALLERGRGRVGVFGEAAMFTAQLGGPNAVPMGMNAPIAGQNAQFALNVMHWLAPRPAPPK